MVVTRVLVNVVVTEPGVGVTVTKTWVVSVALMVIVEGMVFVVVIVETFATVVVSYTVVQTVVSSPHVCTHAVTVLTADESAGNDSRPSTERISILREWTATKRAKIMSIEGIGHGRKRDS